MSEMKPAKAETEAAISQRMVAAGLRVLEESGRLEGQMSSDALLVRRIFRAMRAAEPVWRGPREPTWTRARVEALRLLRAAR